MAASNPNDGSSKGSYDAQDITVLEGLREDGGQSVIATTDLAHVPGADGADVARLTVADGRVRDEVAA